MKKVGALALFVFCALAPAGAAQAAGSNPDVPGMVEKCESGRTNYSTDMAKVTHYPDGGTTYTYRYGNEGETYTIGQPPPGFRPEKASDEELERYSFPPRPVDVGGKGWTEESLSEWEDLVSGYKEAAPPVACEGPSAPYSTNDEPVEYPVYGKSWSGHMQQPIFSNAEERVVATIGKFYEPSGNAYASCKPNALVSNWMGIGGWHSEHLIQAGTGTATNNQHTAWWEAISPSGALPPQYYPALIFGPSSYMGFYAGYNRAQLKAYFYLSNESTGQVIPVTAGLGEKYYDGSSAVAITERPGNGSGGYYPLLNFNYETFWNVTYQNAFNEVRPIGVGPAHSTINMTNTGTASGTLLAEPGGLSLNQNYSMYYSNCQ